MNSERRARLKELLLEHSVQFGEFTLASGEPSTYYIDVRRTALTGEGAACIGEAFWELIESICPGAGGVGGMTLGADPLVTATAIAAHRSGRELGAIIVRKQAKGHGTGRWIEAAGSVPDASSIVVVDDVITTGGSTRLAIERLRERGFVVEHALCVVDREAGGRNNLAEDGVELHALFEVSELVEP